MDFLSDLLRNARRLTSIDFSNMDLTEETVKGVEVPQLPLVTELNFSGNKCTDTNIFEFVHSFLRKTPALRKLNLSDMEMNKDACCDFSLVSVTLQELNVSKNLRFPKIALLNPVLERCVDLRILNISGININKQKLVDSVSFGSISTVLEEFDMSENPENDSVDHINSVFERTRNLVKLNLSNTGITFNMNR